jgi:hypothetical protein
VERIVIIVPKPLPQPSDSSYMSDDDRNVTSVGRFVQIDFILLRYGDNSGVSMRNLTLKN